MQKKFLVNLALSLTLNFLIKPFWIFGIDRTVQNTVGLEAYGFYLNIFNFAFLFNILLDAGITNFNNRNIAQHVHLLNKHFSSLIILKFLLTFIYVGVTFSIALILGYKGEQLVMLAWVGFNQFLLSFILYLRSNISGLLMFITDSFISVLDRLLMIVICSVLLWGNVTGEVFRIEWFVYAQTAAYLATLVIALLIVMSKARFKRLSWNRKFFLVILKKSMPFAVLVLLMSVYNRVDTVYLERLIGGAEGERQVGIYAQGFRLLDAVNQFAWLTAVLLLPIYSRMLKMKLDVSEMIRLPFALLFSAAVIMVSASFFYSHEIIDWLYPRGEGEDPALYAMQLAQSSRVFGILMFGFLGSVTMYVFSTLLTANGNLKQLNLVALSGIGLNMAVNMLLIPKYMATGAAVASLCTQLFTATAYLLVTQYKFRFRVNYRFIFTLALYALLVTGISIISKNLPLPWLAGFGIMLALSLLTAMLLKLINLVEIYHLIKEKTRV